MIIITVYLFTWKALFDALDASGSDSETFASSNGVQAYGVAMANLEQVFLRLGVPFHILSWF